MAEHREDQHFTYLHGYERAETEHFQLFKKYRYKSYASFRESRRQMIFPK